jgi:glucans biosynthesis protein C
MFIAISHSFRMETFFLIAGFLSHLSLQRQGGRAFVAARLFRIGVPFVLHWFILRPWIASGWIMGAASMRGDVERDPGHPHYFVAHVAYVLSYAF